MKNKPNMFRVRYMVMEGDNYAGGYVERKSDITDLDNLLNFNDIKSVTPIYIEEFETMSKEEIQDHLTIAKNNWKVKLKRKEIARKQEDIKRLQKELDK